MMTSNGVPRLVIAKILNHKDSAVTAVYDRHSYDNEKKSDCFFIVFFACGVVVFDAVVVLFVKE